MGLISNFFSKLINTAASVTAPQTAVASASGPVYTLTRVFGSGSTLSLLSGSDSNLSLNTTSGVITAATQPGSGVNQLAIVRESSGYQAIEYLVTISGAPSAPNLTNTLTNSSLAGSAVSGFMARANTLDSELTALGG